MTAEQTWPPEGLLPPLPERMLPPLPEDVYPPGAVDLPEPQPKTLLELRPRFTPELGDIVSIAIGGFGEVMRVARERAVERGHRQVVTRCYDDATRMGWPSLRRFWCIQDWR